MSRKPGPAHSDVLDGKHEEKTSAKRAKTRVPAIGAVIDAFLGGDQHVRTRTAKNYTLVLFKILEQTRGLDNEAARKEKIDILTESLVRDYQAYR